MNDETLAAFIQARLVRNSFCSSPRGPSLGCPPPLVGAPAGDGDFENHGQLGHRLDEMIGYFERKPPAVLSLWGDSIEALMQVTYASANDRAFDAKVRDASGKNLTMLISHHLKRKPKAKFVTCDDFERLLPLAIF